ncbi:prenylcysteine oxidase 1 [Triplophysa rosa]|uniref:Prenylcysteine oxidase 1 n=1 Tax=Triplophysa rosa TaxID=992332 RepID=A0A9W7WCL9_TRIRA|nr:prenylcysteine oxidase 1 [Triplophysa rosa]KAI7793038.1 prenylcysteine oxidase 1 precursor [Triplophysa rosa]
MALRVLSWKTLLFLGLCHVGLRGLATAADEKDPPKKIAIIGGGIGGSAAAYFLRQEFGPSVKIEVFESDTVGGRLATENIGGHDYESGGSIIHPLNLHMKHFVDRLGLSPQPDMPSKLAIFDGKELIYEESDWYIVNFIRMVWRYGLNFIRMPMWMEGVLEKFMRIYQYQQFGYSFSSMEKLLHAMGGEDYVALVNRTLEETMLAEGFSQVFLNDIVMPITRFNYGQTVRLHGFVGAVAISSMDPGLWAVDGGNKKVCSGLLYHSKAEPVQARVTSISMKTRPSKSGSSANFYEVNYVSESGAAQSTYAIVIVATPLHQGLSDINFSGFSPPIPSHFPGQFHIMVTTLVHGVLNVSCLGVTYKPEDFVVSDIFTTDNKASVIQSLHSIDPVQIPKGYSRPPASQKKVWKIFSSVSVSQEELKKVFLSWDSVVEKRWLAYPSYTPPQRGTPPFILHNHLYYLNAVERAASTMEMSAVSARNLALLAHHRWYQQTDKIDQEDLHIKLRSEL